MLMFLVEGWVLATVSMFIACVLYLNYVKMGLGELLIAEVFYVKVALYCFPNNLHNREKKNELFL